MARRPRVDSHDSGFASGRRCAAGRADGVARAHPPPRRCEWQRLGAHLAAAGLVHSLTPCTCACVPLHPPQLVYGELDEPARLVDAPVAAPAGVRRARRLARLRQEAAALSEAGMKAPPRMVWEAETDAAFASLMTMDALEDGAAAEVKAASTAAGGEGSTHEAPGRRAPWDHRMERDSETGA